MEVKLKFGIDRLLFGMRQKDVIALYGEPQKKIIDEDQNILYLYNAQKWQLTFYEDEDFRLGYIIAGNAETTVFGHSVIALQIEEAKLLLKSHGLKSWEMEEFDITENHFNEDNWMVLQSEFGEVTKVEIGAIIKPNDEFDWKF